MTFHLSSNIPVLALEISTVSEVGLVSNKQGVTGALTCAWPPWPSKGWRVRFCAPKLHQRFSGRTNNSNNNKNLKRSGSYKSCYVHLSTLAKHGYPCTFLLAPVHLVSSRFLLLIPLQSVFLLSTVRFRWTFPHR